MSSVTMPTRMYSSGEFTMQAPFLEPFTAFGEGGEHHKCDNSYCYDEQVKHVIPPRTVDSHDLQR